LCKQMEMGLVFELLRGVSNGESEIRSNPIDEE
jgi:hypothetical protein